MSAVRSIEREARKPLGLRRRFVRWLKFSVAVPIGVLVLRALNWTLRWENQGIFSDPNLWQTAGPSILTFWHARQLMAPWYYLGFQGESRVQIAVLISRHEDGRLIAKAMSYLGVDSVSGSSTRGGTEAMLVLVERMRRGWFAGFTPDGPRGPCQRLKPGVVKLAQLSGTPIYLISYSAKRRWTFRSWDAMILPKPFSPAVRVGSGPYLIAADLSQQEFEAKCLELERELVRLDAQADSYWND